MDNSDATRAPSDLWPGVLTILGMPLAWAVVQSTAPDLPFPIRDRAAELSWFLLSYLVAGAFVLAYTRARLPESTRQTALLYVVAFVSRAVCLGWLAVAAYGQDPNWEGQWSYDTIYHSAFIRFVAMTLTGKTYGLEDIGWLAGGVSALPTAGEGAAVYWMPYRVLLAGGVALAGYSTIAIEMPMVACSAAFVVCAWVSMARFVRPVTAFLVAVWMAFSTEFVFAGTTLRKDSFVGIGLLYLIELALQPELPRRRQFLLVIGAVFWIAFVRPEWVPLVGLLWAYARLRLAPRWAARPGRIDLLVCLAALLGGLALAPSQMMFAMAGNAIVSYLAGVVISFFAIPPLAWILARTFPDQMFLWVLTTPALVSPFVFGLRMAGCLFLCWGRMRLPAPALTITFVVLCLACVRGSFSSVSVLLWLPVQPWLVAFTVESALALAEQPARVRRPLTFGIAALAVMFIFANVLYSMR